MTSLCFWLFWKVLDLYCIPTKFHCCQTPNGRVNLGGLFCPPPPVQYRVRPDPVQNRVKKELKLNMYLFITLVKIIRLNPPKFRFWFQIDNEATPRNLSLIVDYYHSPLDIFQFRMCQNNHLVITDIYAKFYVNQWWIRLLTRQCPLKYKECPLKRPLPGRVVRSLEIQEAKATNERKNSAAEESIREISVAENLADKQYHVTDDIPKTVFSAAML